MSMIHTLAELEARYDAPIESSLRKEVDHLTALQRAYVEASPFVVTTTSVYTQCPKALIRSKLWDVAGHRDPAELPSVGQIMQEITEGEFEAGEYDRTYPERVRQTLY